MKQLMKLIKNPEISAEKVIEQLNSNTDLINKKDLENNKTLLHYVVSFESFAGKDYYSLNEKQQKERVEIILAKARKLVEFLAKNQKDINLQDENGKTALHYAAIWDEKIVEYLIDNGANSDIKDNQGCTALYDALGAASSKYEKIINIIIKGSKNLNPFNIINNKKETLLHKVVSTWIRRENKDLIKFLISKDIDLNAQDQNGKTVLHHACHNINSEEVNLLLNNEKLNINILDKDGNTPLHFYAKRAYWKSDEEILKLLQTLLAKNFDIEAKNNYGQTPLHIACKYTLPLYRNKMIKILINNGADVNAVDINGRIPLNYLFFDYFFLKEKSCIVSIKGEINIKNLFLLTEKFAKNVTKNYTETSDKNIKEIASFFEKTKKDFNISDRYNDQTLLHLAAKKGNIVLIKALMHYRMRNLFGIIKYPSDKINLNIKDRLGRTPLHYAVITENIEVVRILIENAAELNIKDNKGKIPFDYVIDKTGEMAKIFKESEKIGRNNILKERVRKMGKFIKDAFFSPYAYSIIFCVTIGLFASFFATLLKHIMVNRIVSECKYNNISPKFDLDPISASSVPKISEIKSI